jgi:hypothetical protein
MPRQLDLLAPPANLQLKARQGSVEPRLWVRRLAIWSEPGVLIRDVSLRPGLNIVWSPDPQDRGPSAIAPSPLGHGSGKTLFCRLLRYCLGEERFAPGQQQDDVAIALRAGLVGAEVVLDGELWAIARSIGIAKRDLAVRHGSIDALATSTDAATGMAPFLEAVEASIITPDVAALMPGTRPLHAWFTALAWLTRDQECRFDDALQWRATASESESPVRNLSGEQTLDALRALMGAIAPIEHELRAECRALERKLSGAETESSHRRWDVQRTRARLALASGVSESDLPAGPLATEFVRGAVRERLKKTAIFEAELEVQAFKTLRVEYEAARLAAEKLAQDLTEVTARLPETERLVSFIRGELPGISVSLLGAQQPICPVCEVPIDRVLAEGCKLSHKLPDADAIKQRRAKCLADIEAETAKVQKDKTDQSRITSELAIARTRTENLRLRLVSAEQARDERREAWYLARRANDDVERLAELYVADASASDTADKIRSVIVRKREEIAAHRDERARVFERVTQVFDAIIRELVTPQASGGVTLDGRGLHLTVQMGGDRSTAAIDSLKVIAFDLAALCMSIEGTTFLPAFLVHDSPREADLGLGAYYRIFQFARSLEAIGGTPLFQYIITTTTSPPEELLSEPWLRLKLEGSPAQERLLRRDL